MNSTVQLTRALEFAATKHADQRRTGQRQEPYINHLIEVANMVSEATEGSDIPLLIACLLHDTIEDQGVPYTELLALFGKDVADLVQEATDDHSLDKAERRRVQFVEAPMKSRRAKMLKIADKVSNIRSMITSLPGDWDEQNKGRYLAWVRISRSVTADFASS